MTNELSPKLASRLSAPVRGLLDVVVELDEAAKEKIRGATDISSMREAYAACAAPLKTRIAELGGSVVDEVWLNSTLMAQLPAEAIGSLSNDPGVSLLDLPGELERD